MPISASLRLAVPDPAVKTRADLLAVNLPATRKCARLLRGFSGLLITVTNPMDVNNFLLHHLTGIPRERCIGFGGQLDSARFTLALRQRELEGTAYVLGEHGEYQVPVFPGSPGRSRTTGARRSSMNSKVPAWK